jgi:hypothetical protein
MKIRRSIATNPKQVSRSKGISCKKGRMHCTSTNLTDGVVSSESYQRLSSEWNAELSSIGYKIDLHQRTSKNYLDYGAKLLKLAQHAVIINKYSNAEEKRRILKIVHSNSFWRDGELTANFQKPSDSLAVTNKSYKQKKVTFPEKSDLRDNWPPSADGSGTGKSFYRCNGSCCKLSLFSALPT